MTLSFNDAQFKVSSAQVTLSWRNTKIKKQFIAFLFKMRLIHPLKLEILTHSNSMFIKKFLKCLMRYQSESSTQKESRKEVKNCFVDFHVRYVSKIG